MNADPDPGVYFFPVVCKCTKRFTFFFCVKIGKKNAFHNFIKIFTLKIVDFFLHLDPDLHLGC